MCARTRARVSTDLKQQEALITTKMSTNRSCLRFPNTTSDKQRYLDGDISLASSSLSYLRCLSSMQPTCPASRTMLSSFGSSCVPFPHLSHWGTTRFINLGLLLCLLPGVADINTGACVALTRVACTNFCRTCSGCQVMCFTCKELARATVVV